MKEGIWNEGKKTKEGRKMKGRKEGRKMKKEGGK
jgi:hypothetical protein